VKLGLGATDQDHEYRDTGSTEEYPDVLKQELQDPSNDAEFLQFMASQYEKWQRSVKE